MGLWAGLVAVVFQLIVVAAAGWFYARARTHAAAIAIAAWGGLLRFVLLGWPRASVLSSARR